MDWLSFSTPKNPFCTLLTLIVAGALLTGCQTTMLTSDKGQSIQPSAQIRVLPEGTQSGTFSDGYVRVTYQYTASPGSLQLAGTITFGDAISMNFNQVETFDLGLLLGDNQGKVLLQQGLTTASAQSSSDSIKFKTTVLLPARTSCMAFTYNGMVYGAGGQSPTSIWADPVVR
jgi:hypothetical protein